MNTEPISVLLDNSAFSDGGDAAHGVTEAIPGMVNRLFLVQARPAEKSKWRREQIESLPTVARLAREGIIKLYTYNELVDEHWRKPGSYPHQWYGDVFANVKVEWVSPAVKRGVFFQSDWVKHNNKAALIKFCKWLLNGYSERWLTAPIIAARLTQTDIGNLSDLDRFKAICALLSEKHYDDAFHIWTGELAGLSVFLTTNRNFVNALRQHKGLDLRCRPIFPTELLGELGVTHRDPMPYAYGRRYLLDGIPYD